MRNTLKRLTWLLLVHSGFIICCQSNHTQHKANSVAEPKENFTLYSKATNSVKVARLLSFSDTDFMVCKYVIDISKPEEAQQKFDTLEHITQKQIVKLKKELQTAYNWKPLTQTEVLFVQLQPKGFKDGLQLLDKRQEIEEKLDDELKEKSLGDWYAGDIGPGGGNMLYDVKNVNEAMSVILDVLKENDIEKNVVIGRRVLTDKDDWFYEVVYPVIFSGKFNTM